MSALRHIALASLALTLGACSLIIDDTAHRVTNHCGADTDCAGTAHCDTTSAMCVEDPAVPYDLWLEVAPPTDASGTTPSPVDLGPYRTFSGTDDVHLVVAHQITARGTVTRDGQPVTAQITFTPRPATMTPLAVRSISTRTDAYAAFSTSLPARTDYDVLVEPVGDFRSTVPPFRYPLFSVMVSDAALQIGLPVDETQIEGDVVNGVIGVSGYEVIAVDRATGAQLSAVAATDLDASAPGHFVLHMRPTTDAFDLVIRPGSTRPDPSPVPTFRVRPEVLLPDAHGNVQILVPASQPLLHWGGTVEYPESRGSTPVAGAVLQLHSDDVADVTTGVVGTIDLSIATDANGVYDAQVPPGTYSVTITPSAAADDVLGVLREVRDLRPTVGPDLIGHVFRLPLRTVLGGTVQSPDGDLVRDASVRATPLGLALAGLTDPDVARFARPAMARSGPMGDFRLDLDVGVYDIVVEPPDGSGFPWTVVLGYGIGGSTATLADVMQVDAPVVVDGDVTWADGGDLAGAEVRAFAITTDNRAVMVGRATSDAHGHVQILVPAALATHDPTMAFSRH